MMGVSDRDTEWIYKNPERGRIFLRHRSGGAAQTGRETTYQCGVDISFNPHLTPKSDAMRRLASADSLSSGRCGKLLRYLCSEYVDPLHTTSFRWAYCTLLFGTCQAFTEILFRKPNNERGWGVLTSGLRLSLLLWKQCEDVLKLLVELFLFAFVL